MTQVMTEVPRTAAPANTGATTEGLSREELRTVDTYW
jgi:hypothetical protein